MTGPFRGKTISPRLAVDKRKLGMLAAEMGLKGGCPLVTFTDYPRSGVLGRYTGRRTTRESYYGQHKVSLARWMNPLNANWVLCHELTHALQAQDFDTPRDFGREWFRQMREVGIRLADLRAGAANSNPDYRTTKFEAEANASADKWLDWCYKEGIVPIDRVDR